MAEYIEREALLEKAKELAGGVFGTPRIIVAIKNAPKADVVEVVRCKECKHSTLTFGTYICDNIQTPWFNDEFAIDVGANDFCSYGIRKEGAEECF